MSADKLVKLGIRREPKYLYFIKAGAVWRRPQGSGGNPEKIADTGIEHEVGYIYSLDADGDVIRTPTVAVKKAAPASDAIGAVTFAAAFSPLAAFVGKEAYVATTKRHGGLAKGSHALTVFDWTKLEDESREMFVEAQLRELVAHLGDKWTDRMVPVAVVGGESHPVPLDELDQQCDGVLLVDLARGGAVVYLDDPSSDEPMVIAANADALDVSDGDDADDAAADDDDDDDDDA